MALKSERYDARRHRLIAQHVLGPRVLDLGYAQSPNPWLRAYHTVGVDLERPRDPSGYAEELIGDAMDLRPALGTRKFNTIVAAELIEHLERPYDFLRGLHPFLVPGGRLVISTPNVLGFPSVLFEVLGSTRFYYWREHRYAFAPRWVRRALEVTGFELEVIRSVGLQLVFLVPPCPRWMSYQLIYVARQLSADGAAQ